MQDDQYNIGSPGGCKSKILTKQVYRRRKSVQPLRWWRRVTPLCNTRLIVCINKTGEGARLAISKVTTVRRKIFSSVRWGSLLRQRWRSAAQSVLSG